MKLNIAIIIVTEIDCISGFYNGIYFSHSFYFNFCYSFKLRNGSFTSTDDYDNKIVKKFLFFWITSKT